MEELLPVLLNRRFLTCGATVFALLIGSASAVAATHAAHTTRISGVIVSINATRHTLKLRVTHGTKHHKAVTVRAASAGDSRGVLVAFGDRTGPSRSVKTSRSQPPERSGRPRWRPRST